MFVLSAACLAQSYRDYVLEAPEGVQLACTVIDVPATPVDPIGEASLTVLDARPPSLREAQAGRLLNADTFVPFVPGTRPAAILRADLETRLTARGVRLLPAAPVRIEARLTRAHVQPRIGLLENRLEGGVEFDFEVIRRRDGAVLWRSAVAGRSTSTQRTHTSSLDYGEALGEAYCAALAEASAWVSTRPFQQALTGERSVSE